LTNKAGDDRVMVLSNEGALWEQHLALLIVLRHPLQTKQPHVKRRAPQDSTQVQV
jgi:hypothetical protein